MPRLDHPAPLTLRGHEFHFGRRTYLMGIINVTPDSFSGDGLLAAAGESISLAVERAEAMVAAGADFIDVGGESTRPGSEAVSAPDESARILGVVAGIRARLPDIPISIDTTKQDVAAAALDTGADMINDVAAITAQVKLAPLAAQRGVPYILMHSRRRAEYADLVPEVIDDLGSAIAAAQAAGCHPASLLVDPGIGFGKTAEQNLLLLRELGALHPLGKPILLGASRKSTIGRVLDLPVEDRLEGTLATTALGIAAGVDIVRVHDIAANARVARMSDAIIRGGWQDTGAPSPVAGVRRQP